MTNRLRMLATILALAPLTLASLSVTAAAVYKWVDENGKVHYGERPPNGAASKRIKVTAAPAAQQPSSAPSTAERLDKRRKLLKSYAADRAEKREQKAKLAAQRNKLKAQCAKLKKYLQQEQSAKYLYRKDKAGNKIVVSDKERVTQVAGVKKEYKKHC